MPSLPNSPVNAGEKGVDEMVELAPATQAKVGPKPIEVMAIMNGYWAPHRKNGGDIFTVPSFKHLSHWMKCTDPVMQKKHEANMKANARAANAAAMDSEDAEE